MIEVDFSKMMSINPELYIKYYSHKERKPKWVNYLFSLFIVFLFFGINQILIRIWELNSATKISSFFDPPSL